eukprot:COSAG01_NODE_18709_length_1058_cov_1.755996_2_plen_56_part_01
MLARGHRSRAQASTKSNARSSRSHAIFVLDVQSYHRGTGVTTLAHLYAVGESEGTR